MKKLFIFAIFALAAPSVFGQTKGQKNIELVSAEAKTASKTEVKAEEVVVDKPTFQRFDNMVVPDERYEGVKGSHYFYDEKFHEGVLTMTKAREMGKGYLFRFDQLEGTVQMKFPDGREILVDQKEVLTFNFFVEDKSVIFMRMKTPKDPQNFTLVQVIYYSKNVKLVRDIHKKMKRVENTGAYSSNTIYDTFDNDYHYYLQRDADEIVEVKPTVKSFSKNFPEKGAKVEKLFKAAKSKGDLSVSKLAEIVKQLDDKPLTDKK
jgi:hypothetical protein